MLFNINGLTGLIDQLSEPFRVLSRLLKAALIALIVVTSVAPFGTSEANAYVRVSYSGRSYYGYPYRYGGYYYYRGGIYRHRYYRYGRWHYY